MKKSPNNILLEDLDTIILDENKIVDWIKAKLRKITGKQDKQPYISLGRSGIKKGYVLIYNYISKLYDEDKLMFYDEYPLTIVTSSDSKYFWGFNLHYVPKNTKQRLIRFLKNQYPRQFNTPNYVRPLPGFNYDKFKLEFPYIADAMIKMYIKSNTNNVTIISLEELEKLAKIDTSRFIFKTDSEITSVEQLHANWKKSRSLAQRNRKVSSRIF